MTNSSSIGFPTKSIFGAGSIAIGVKDTAFNLFLLFFYTQVAGLTGSLAGAAIFTALVIDAVTDPMVGFWSDRLNSRLGRRHPFMYLSALPMGLSFYFLFCPPQDAAESSLFLWMLSWAVLTRVFMTFYQVPSTALTAEITSDYDERTSLSGYRVMFGWLGGLVFATVGYLVFFAPNDSFADRRLDPAAYQDLALVGAVAIVVTILACALGTHHLIPRLRAASADSSASLGLVGDFKNVLGNGPFLVLGAVIFLSAATIGFTESVSLYMYTYFWGLSTEQLAGLTVTAALGTFVAFSVIPRLTRRFDKRPVLTATMAMLMLAYPSLILLRNTGVLPDNDPNLTLMILSLNAAIKVFASVGMTTLFVSMIADTVDRNELMTGQRQEAIFTSVFTFSFKATSGMGGLMAGLMLDFVDFPTGEAAAKVSQETLNALGLSVAMTILIAWGISMLVLRRYSLNREEHEDILAQIAAQKAG